jgi:hypothetical protein
MRVERVCPKGTVSKNYCATLLALIASAILQEAVRFKPSCGRELLIVLPVNHGLIAGHGDKLGGGEANMHVIEVLGVFDVLLQIVP